MGGAKGHDAHTAASCPNPRCEDGWVTRDSDGSKWRCRHKDCPSSPAASCPKYGGKVCRPEAAALCECYPGKKPSAANVHGLLAARVRLALRSLDVAIAATKPFAIRALFSGGGDSMVAAHIAARHEFFGGCVFIDTGTALPGVIEFAQETCEAQGWPLSVIRSPQTYEDMIVRNGLPGPGQHPTAYVRLKEKALDAHVRELCTRCAAGERHIKHDTVMWISGARASESVRRMGQSGWVTVDGSQVWVNPILDWDNSECRAYRDLCELPMSDVAAMVHRSGECNCGTYASKGEREMLRDLYPEFAARMDGWEDLAREHGHDNAAVWGQRPTEKLKDQLEIPRVGELACSGCAARFTENESGLEEVA